MTQESGAEESGGSGLARAVRFIFEYEDDEVRLVTQQWVDVAVTGFDVAAGRAMAPGNYVEMRAADGAALADVRVRQDLGRSMEVFPEEPGAPITRTEMPNARGAFTVVVPAPEGVSEVAIVRVARTPDVPEPGAEAPPPEAGGAPPLASDLATFAFEPQG